MDKITLSFTREEFEKLIDNSISFKRIFMDQLFADKPKRVRKPKEVTLESLAKDIVSAFQGRHFDKIAAIKELRLVSQKYPNLLNHTNSHTDDNGNFTQVGLAAAKNLIEKTWKY